MTLFWVGPCRRLSSISVVVFLHSSAWTAFGNGFSTIVVKYSPNGGLFCSPHLDALIDVGLALNILFLALLLFRKERRLLLLLSFLSLSPRAVTTSEILKADVRLVI